MIKQKILRWFSPDIRASYLVCAAIAIGLVWWGAVHFVSVEKEQITRQSADRAARLATVFEQNTLKILSYADHFIMMLRRDYMNSVSIDTIRQIVGDHGYNRDMVSHFTIIGPDGTPLYVSGHDIKPGATAKDRDYFKHFVANENDGLYISPPHRGRNTGKLTMRLVRRITLPDGGFGGVVFAAIDVTSLTAFFTEINIGPKSAATLIGSDKIIRAHAPATWLGPGQNVSASQLWSELEKSPSGVYRQTSLVDNVTRYHAYRKLAEFPLIVSIGVSTQDLEAEVGEFELPAYLIAGLISIIIIVVTILVHRKVYRVRYEFLANMSHELRTPLNAIIGYAEMMEHKIFGPLGDPHYEDYVKSISTSGQHLLSVINDLLDLSKIDAGKLELEEDQVFVGQAIGFALDINKSMAEAKNIDLITSLSRDDLGLIADDRLVKQILLNLVSNAVKFTPEGGRVSVMGSVKRNGAIELIVQDNGVGMDEDGIARSQVPFARIKDPKLRTVEGTGLGLSLTRQLVELHGGQLEIESQLGKGTRVTVRFPARRTVRIAA